MAVILLLEGQPLTDDLALRLSTGFDTLGLNRLHPAYDLEGKDSGVGQGVMKRRWESKVFKNREMNI